MNLFENGTDSDMVNIKDNFLMTRGFEIVCSSYENNHIKLLEREEVNKFKRIIKDATNRDVIPFLRTNLCDVFLYDVVTKTILLYYCRCNEFDVICDDNDVAIKWFVEDFLTHEDILSDVFNSELFDVSLESNQVLYCPPFFEELKENYKAMDVDMALHLYYK